MKSPIMAFCMLLISLLLISCQKSDEVPSNNTLSGTWELRQTYSNAKVDYVKDNGHILQLNQNIYKVYEGGKTVSNGSFTTLPDSTVSATVGLIIAKNTFANRIVFKDFDTKVFYHLSNDTLYLMQGFFPADSGVKTTYVKIQ